MIRDLLDRQYREPAMAKGEEMLAVRGLASALRLPWVAPAALLLFEEAVGVVGEGGIPSAAPLSANGSRPGRASLRLARTCLRAPARGRPRQRCRVRAGVVVRG